MNDFSIDKNQPLLRNRIDRILDDFCKNEESQPRAIAYLRPVRPIAQNGPQCGLVALHMAAEALSPNHQISLDFIFDQAKRIGITNNGEIFSVQWLANLISAVYPNRTAEVIEIDRLSINPRSIVSEALLSSKFLLVPYDTDKNHEPCLNHGHTAHWALILGFLIVDTETVPDTIENMETTPERIYWINRSIPADFSRNLSISTNDNFFVFALHGKSKHVSVWSLEKLLSSNDNLCEIGPKRLNDGLEYKMPLEGVLGGLCGKFLVFG